MLWYFRTEVDRIESNWTSVEICRITKDKEVKINGLTLMDLLTTLVCEKY